MRGRERRNFNEVKMENLHNYEIFLGTRNGKNIGIKAALQTSLIINFYANSSPQKQLISMARSHVIGATGNVKRFVRNP